MGANEELGGRLVAAIAAMLKAEGAERLVRSFAQLDGDPPRYFWERDMTDATGGVRYLRIHPVTQVPHIVDYALLGGLHHATPDRANIDGRSIGDLHDMVSFARRWLVALEDWNAVHHHGQGQFRAPPSHSRPSRRKRFCMSLANVEEVGVFVS